MGERKPIESETVSFAGRIAFDDEYDGGCRRPWHFQSRSWKSTVWVPAWCSAFMWCWIRHWSMQWKKSWFWWIQRRNAKSQRTRAKWWKFCPKHCVKPRLFTKCSGWSFTVVQPVDFPRNEHFCVQINFGDLKISITWCKERSTLWQWRLYETYWCP